MPFADNIIPANRISPIAQNYLKYYPVPNQPGQPNGQANFLSNTDGERNTFYNTIGRMTSIYPTSKSSSLAREIIFVSVAVEMGSASQFSTIPRRATICSG